MQKRSSADTTTATQFKAPEILQLLYHRDKHLGRLELVHRDLLQISADISNASPVVNRTPI